MLTISQLARAVGVNVQTVRFYEREKIIAAPARSRAGYRQYGAETVSIVSFIKRAQTLGFTLKEVQELLTLRSSPRANRLKARAAAQAKIRDIDARLRDLTAIRSSLMQLVTQCTRGRKGAVCPILDAVEHDDFVA